MKDAFRESLRGHLAKVHEKVVGQYGPDAPDVADIFPQGRSIFHTATDDRLTQYLATLANGVSALVAELGAPLETEGEGILAEWEAIYAQSESAGGATTTTQAAKRTAREALQLELFRNLLALAGMFPRQGGEAGSLYAAELAGGAGGLGAGGGGDFRGAAGGAERDRAGPGAARGRGE